MALAPIRGAPPDAAIPDFPLEEPQAQPAAPAVAPASGEQPPTVPVRQRLAPIAIGGGGITLTFRVIPELPAIARASMSIDVADATGRSAAHGLGSLRMSDADARAFLTELRQGRSPLVATGDEAGTVRIAFEITAAGAVCSVRKAGLEEVLCRCVLDRHTDLQAMAEALLADLGS